MTQHQSELGQFDDGQSEKVRLKYLARINPQKSEIDNLPADTEVSFVPLEKFGTDGSINSEETKPIEEVYDGYTYFREGDIAIAKITPSFQNGKGAICRRLENGIGFGTTELHVIRPNEDTYTKFLWYALRAKPFMDGGVAFMKGVAGQQRVPSEFVEDFRVMNVSQDLQHKIADFLECRTGRIDALIAKKQKLLELLAEKRQSIITRAINDGIQTDAPRRKSGSQWLGEIPEHWDVTKLMYLVRDDAPIIYGILKPGPDVEDGIPYIGAGDIMQGRLTLNDLPKTSPDIAEEYERSKMSAGEIVYAIRGSFGSVAVLPQELEGVNLSRDAARIAPRDDVDAHWLCWALRSESSQRQFEINETGATITGVNIGDLKRLVLPHPPFQEQESIASFLSEYQRRYENLTDTVERGLSLLEEKRQALITAAVTGQIDVSDWEPQEQEAPT